ncbi:MAG TPA: acyl-CoA dehydrogenase family protein [Acidimicrobiales bacterium]|nr:acyl-CoA dehydrogenase family protein [Acidimicrobiales bacterium]
MPADMAALAERLYGDAAAVDAADSIPPAHLGALAAAGLYGALAPKERGGLGLDVPGLCAVVEELASACLATTFVWIQHLDLLGTLLDPAAPPVLREMLPKVVSGEVRSGIALAGLRSGMPGLRARELAGGWLLDGEASWVSGWGLVDVLLVAARGPDDSAVRLVVDAREQLGLSVTRLRLSALDATCTARIAFEGLFVAEERVASRRPYDPTTEQREGLRVNGSLALGLVRRCCTLLGPSALDDELVGCRDDLDVAGPDAIAGARARASELAVRAAHVLSVRQGSRSVLAGDVAERLAREAAMLLVFGSRPAIRRSLLERLGAPLSR